MKKQKIINIKTTIGMTLATKYIAKYDLDFKDRSYTESQLINKAKTELEKEKQHNRETEGVQGYYRMVMYTFELIVDGVIVGYAVGQLSEHASILSCLFISKKHRGQGYGSLLMDEFIQNEDAKITYISIKNKNIQESDCMFFTPWGFGNVFHVIDGGVLVREDSDGVQKATNIYCPLSTISEYFN